MGPLLDFDLPHGREALLARRLEAALALLLLLGACEPESDRPVLASYRPGVPLVPASLVGTWRCSDLNPYPDQPQQAITTTYAADGSFESNSVIPKRGPVGAIQVVQRGRWSIDAGRLVTADVITDAHAMDGNTSTEALAKASAQTVDAMSAGKSAASEVLRLDARRLTLRPADVDRPAGHRLSAISESLALAAVSGTTYDGFRDRRKGEVGCAFGSRMLSWRRSCC